MVWYTQLKNGLNRICKIMRLLFHTVLDALAIYKRLYLFLIGSITFLLTIAGIIVSINSAVFKGYDTYDLNVYNFNNPIHVLAFALKQQRNYERGGRDLEVREVRFDPTLVDTVRHVVIVDNTGSIQLKSVVKQALIDVVMQSDTSSDNSRKQQLNKLNEQSLLALALIGQMAQSHETDQVYLYLYNGYVEGLDSTFLFHTVLNDLNDNGEHLDSLISWLITYSQPPKDHLTMFDKLLSKKVLQKGMFTAKSTSVFILSDFEHDNIEKDILSINGVEDKIFHLANKEHGKGRNLQLNLIVFKDEKSTIQVHLKNAYDEKADIYEYDYEELKENIEDKILSTAAFTCMNTKEESDIILYKPNTYPRKQYRRDKAKYQRVITLPRGDYYFSKRFSPEGLYIYEADTLGNSLNNRLVTVHDKKIDSVSHAGNRCYFLIEQEQDQYHAPAKLDIYDKASNRKYRFLIWQTHYLTRAGALYYAFSVFFSFILIIFFLALTVYLSATGCATFVAGLQSNFDTGGKQLEDIWWISTIKRVLSADVICISIMNGIIWGFICLCYWDKLECTSIIYYGLLIYPILFFYYFRIKNTYEKKEIPNKEATVVEYRFIHHDRSLFFFQDPENL